MYLREFSVLFSTLLAVCLARKHSPLIGDEGGRRTQAAECQFGKSLKELGSTWFADLGPPFGVMYCIRCECVPYHRKRRVVGKVHCRNIKHECPKPSCDEPVLPPGRCCKVCPGDLDSPDNIVEEQVPTAGVEEEKNLKHFAAVLVPKTIPGVEDMAGPLTDASLDYKATGRFTFHKRNLYYSFYTTARPRGVQFVDMRGNILEEQVLTPFSNYQNDTEKVCGVWRRIPREYRRLIREERLQVTLLWERAELAITGQLYRYRTLATELYTALLEGPKPTSAGTAIVSVSTLSAPSIHLTLVFTGVFSADDAKDTPVTVTLKNIGGKEKIVLEEIVRVEKPSTDINVIEVRSTVSNMDLNQMSKQRLSVTVTTKMGVSVSGLVRTRATCELFQAPLSAPGDHDEGDAKTSGMAWMYVDKIGALRYHVRLDGITQPDMLGLVVERRLVELEDLTPSFHNGWANGTVDQLNTRHLEQLYAGELAVNVATTATRSLVRGKLSPRPVADARDTASPSLLLQTDREAGDMTGMIWAAVDNECNLHYEVVLSGWSEDRTLGLYLEDVPLIAPGAPVSRRLLEEFNTNSVEGFVLGLTPAELTRLDTGVVNFDIKDLHTSKSLLRAHWRQVSIPPSCLPHYNDNNVPPVNNVNSDTNTPEQTSCFHSEAFHEEGSQWPSRGEPCTICNCHLGRVKCDPVVCPTQPCANPTLKTGQCCPTCDNSTLDSTNVSQGCYLAGQMYAPGSSWHPYLPPAGFDTCATCHCNSSTLAVKCSRVVCPPLECDEGLAVRRTGCCKVCPAPPGAPAPVPGDPAYLGDQQVSVVRTKSEILAAGGCVYPVGRIFENGENWHPRVYSHGEVKSVTCHCKDGTVKCERRRHH